MSNLLEKSRQHLSAQGGRLTAQRRLILETLDGMTSHPTAEELFEQVHGKDPSIHLSTVYRTLRWLESEDLISVRTFDQKDRSERFDPALPEEHYHFLCLNCNKVIEFNTLLVNAIKAQFELHYGAQVVNGSVVLHGICHECRRKGLTDMIVGQTQPEELLPLQVEPGLRR